jgi:hypothetical protein
VLLPHLIDEFVIVHLAICTATHVPGCDDLQHSHTMAHEPLLRAAPTPHPESLRAGAHLLPILLLLLLLLSFSSRSRACCFLLWHCCWSCRVKVDRWVLSCCCC